MASEELITPPATLSWPALFEPREEPSGEAKFSAQFIVPADAPGLAEIKAAVERVAVNRFGPDAKKKLATGALKNPLRDGAEKSFRGYGPGTVFFTAKSNRQPGVVGRYADPETGKPIAITDPEQIYSGCTVRASVIPFAYSVNGNSGVSFLLGNLQKIADGERLDGRMKAADEFEAFEPLPEVEVDDDDDDNGDDPFES